jgi:hypothetical protein
MFLVSTLGNLPQSVASVNQDQLRMSVATTIVFAREDFTIPGAAETVGSGRDRPDAAQTRFFDLISRSSPDVIVLDFSRGPVRGTDTILTVGDGPKFLFWWYAIPNNHRWMITALPVPLIVLPHRSISSA